MMFWVFSFSFFILLGFLFLLFSTSLLMSLLLLEIMGFSLLFFMFHLVASSLGGAYIVVLFFVIFVMEGVIALSGLIILVSASGSDYISGFSFVQC